MIKFRVVGELVTPPELDSGELAGSNPAYSTVLVDYWLSVQIVTLVDAGSIPV
jgi:hypothetical protein